MLLSGRKKSQCFRFVIHPEVQRNKNENEETIREPGGKFCLPRHYVDHQCALSIDKSFKILRLKRTEVYRNILNFFFPGLLKEEQDDATVAVSLLRSVLKDACCNFTSVNLCEEADAIITPEEIQDVILHQLQFKLNQDQKAFITLNLIKAELIKNNMFSTSLYTDKGHIEVWLLKEKIPVNAGVQMHTV
jgi:hypothetical protein